MKKRKLQKQLHKTRQDAYIRAAVLRSCHDFAQMVLDMLDLHQNEWLAQEVHTIGCGIDIEAILRQNAQRIREMTDVYTK